MSIVAIASIVSLFGAVLAALFVVLRIGFRPAAGEPDLSQRLPARGQAPAGSLEAQVRDLAATVRELKELVTERELSDQVRWQVVEESRGQIRQLEDLVREARLDFKKRLHDSEQSRLRRELELERNRRERAVEGQRELEAERGRERERELGQKPRYGQPERSFTSS